jgi:predicted DNA-binding transcriptional regulator AlpA
MNFDQRIDGLLNGHRPPPARRRSRETMNPPPILARDHQVAIERGIALHRVVLLTDAQVAELIGVNRRQVHKLAAAGELPRPVKVGKRSRWRLSELEHAIESMARR